MYFDGAGRALRCRPTQEEENVKKKKKMKKKEKDALPL